MVYNTWIPLLVVTIFSTGVLVTASDRLPLILRYETDSPSDQFVPLPNRRKRDVDLDDPLKFKLPGGYEEEVDSSDHIYYIKNVTNGEKAMSAHFVDIDAMLKRDGVTGNSSHPLLSKSYRRAVGAKVGFEFPFYGHYMRNLTIATGGFLYIGDQAHNWLAATQYIAPLMANFDTHLEDANVIYASDGSKFVVEWRKVQAREHYEDGPFTFQVTLHKNGDIVFAYKDVPMDASNISDTFHPVKIGISDAYLYNHVMKTTAQPTPPPRRVIYEYHRVEVEMSQVKSNTVVYLQAQPTCMALKSCEQCSNSTLKHFTCSWCHSKKEHGGPFCTDQEGMHRRRQTWVQGNCKDQGMNMYCSGDQSDEVEDSEQTAVKSHGDHPDASKQPDDVINLDGKKKKGQSTAGNNADGGNAYAALVFSLGLSLCLIGWLAYAYYNPHTSSGQLLIKYRPSRWHVPNSHVRYSASVHM